MPADKNSITINELIKLSHDTAVTHGWWRDGRCMPGLLALIHSEVSEALEECRRSKDYAAIHVKNGKPEGFPIELADVLIRIADLCGRYVIDLDKALKMKLKYNESRPYRHGNKLF
jgi:NTP pyrophosphatase (non-canonical NTP hydrolase)